jgi:hypothetical protein
LQGVVIIKVNSWLFVPPAWPDERARRSSTGHRC